MKGLHKRLMYLETLETHTTTDNILSMNTEQQQLLQRHIHFFKRTCDRPFDHHPTDHEIHEYNNSRYIVFNVNTQSPLYPFSPIIIKVYFCHRDKYVGLPPHGWMVDKIVFYWDFTVLTLEGDIALRLKYNIDFEPTIGYKKTFSLLKKGSQPEPLVLEQQEEILGEHPGTTQQFYRVRACMADRTRTFFQPMQIHLPHEQ
jgi:hypothetical protein